mmetsp:Transcript_6679/g.9130  ORF Transcript_6679/g.9130 Transcript_6679/m.9130 type:complete len:94 (-) Transcript_6679:148-429(-)
MHRLRHFVHAKQTPIHFVPADHHVSRELHVFFAEPVELIVATGPSLVTRLSQNELTELIDENSLAAVQQTDQRCHCYSLPLEELLKIHFFSDS